MVIWEMLVVSIAVLTFLLSPVLSYSTGAPDQACIDLTPRHGFREQTTASPYSITPASKTYCNSRQVSVTIKGGNFKGLLCQARKQDTGETVGTLKGADDNKPTRNTCGGEAALTHSSNKVVSSVQFTWTPDQSDTSDIYFICTVVASRTTFWIQQRSETLTNVDQNNCPTVGLPTLCASDQACNAAVQFSICNKDADDDGNCVCPSDRKFVNPTDTSCSQKVLGDSCGATGDCKYVSNSTCDSTKGCACATGFVEKQNQCATEEVSDVTCQIDSDCSRFQFARCDTQNTRCHCTADVKEENGRCVKKGLDDNCEKGTDCSNIANSFCDSSKCICRPSFLQENGGCVPDPTFCKADTCSDPNSVCNAGNCICMSAYKGDNDTCVPKVLDDGCVTNDDCKAVPSSQCDTSLCKCQDNYKAVSSVKCEVKGLDDRCEKTSECSNVTHSACDSTTATCKCMESYIKQDGRCVQDQAVCTSDTFKNVPNSVCQSGNCVCLSTYEKVGGTCTVDEDCLGVSNTRCDQVGKECVCVNGYKQVGDKCDIDRRGLGEACVVNENCALIPMSICAADKRCTCVPGYMQQGNGCVQQGTCTVDEDCLGVSNSRCDPVGKECVCLNGYKQVGDKCDIDRRGLGEACVLNENCALISMSICAADKRCTCVPGYMELGNGCVQQVSDIDCDTDGDCSAIYMALCDVDKKCVCPDGYMRNASRCQQRGDGCRVDVDCKGVSMTFCDVTSKCACVPWYKQRTNTQCEIKGLDDSCMFDSDCRSVQNARCDDTCTCMTAYKEQSNQTHRLCVVRDIGDTCKHKDECAGIRDSDCNAGTEKCVCPPGLKVRNYGCEPKVLQKSCTSPNDCMEVENTICRLAKCTCAYGYDNNLELDTCVNNGLIGGATSNMVVSGGTLLVCFVLQTLICRLKFL